MSNLVDKYKSSKKSNTKPYSGQTRFKVDTSSLNIDVNPKPYNPASANAGSRYAPKTTTRYTP
jgi:hypothetical protein